MKDIAQNTFISYIPNWLRWVLFIPLASAMLFIVSVMSNLIQTIIGQQDNMVIEYIRIFILVFTFITVAAAVSPKRQSKVALIVGIICAATALIALLLSALLTLTDHDGSINIVPILITSLAVIAASTLGYFTVRKLGNVKEQE